jgi:hypothetical protein
VDELLSRNITGVLPTTPLLQQPCLGLSQANGSPHDILPCACMDFQICTLLDDTR